MRSLLSLSIAMSLCLAASVAAGIEPKAAKELYERATPSLVVVKYTYDNEAGRRDLITPGIVVSDDGLIIFSGAVVSTTFPDEQMKDFKIIVPPDNEKELDAVFQGRDERTGLAFVKPKEPRKWTPLKFEERPIEVGDDLLSVGILPKDAGYKSYLVTGSVSSFLRGPVPQIMVTGGGLSTVGSPVFNAQGQAIGMVHSQSNSTPFLNSSPDRSLDSVYVPPRVFVPAREFLISLTDWPTPEKPLKIGWLGASQLNGLKSDTAEYYGLKNQPAVQVGEVIPGFPAAKAGLKAGDIIVKMNGEALEPGDDPDEVPAIMTHKIMRMPIGQAVVLSVLRGKGQPLQDITVTLEERTRPANKAARFFAEDLGFTTRELVFSDTYSHKLPADAKGVLVAYIKQSSSAQTGKLRGEDLITMLNQTPVENLEQFKSQYQAFRKDHPRDAVVVEVQRRDGTTEVIRIEPPR